jgi:hypothetical protein
MTATLPLPPLVGTRHRAQALAAKIPDDLTGATVIVDGRNLLAATESFADELVRILVVERHAAMMTVRNITDADFAGWVLERAKTHGVADRVHVEYRAAAAPG